MTDLEKRELMIKAAVKLKGVWPDPKWGKNLMYDGDGEVFYTGSTTRKAEIVCTRAEFEEFVDSLFESAPDGATHVDATRGEFYKNGSPYLKISKEFSEMLKINDHFQSTLIPLPKAEPEKWMPQVGEECLLLNEQNYSIEYGQDLIGRSVVVESLFQSSSSSRSIAMAAVSHNDVGCYCFRQDMLHPLKTEAEKERERVIDNLAKFIFNCDTSVLTCEADIVAKELFDAGLIKEGAFDD